MSIRRSASQAPARYDKARRAVGSHLNVNFTLESVRSVDPKLRNRDDVIQAVLDRMGTVKNGSPSLVFVFSDEMKPRARGKHPPPPKPTMQARDSAAAWEELFQKEGDYSVFIPGRFFNIVRVDATNVTAA